MGFVATHVRPHRGALAVTYGAALIENTFELLYPFAIGSLASSPPDTGIDKGRHLPRPWVEFHP